MVRKIPENNKFYSWNSFDAEELSQPVTLAVYTRCPEKYALIDMETGQLYVGTTEVNPHVPSQQMWKELK